MPRKMPIFYSALMLTGVNLFLRLMGTSFQVYLSGRIGAAGVGLLQLVLSVGGLTLTAGMAGIRTATMYLTAEALGRRQPEKVGRVLSVCFCYSLLCSLIVGGTVYFGAPRIAEQWIGNSSTVYAVRLVAVFLPINCLCGVMTGYFTAANRIALLSLVEIGEQACSMGVTMTLLSLWAGSDPGRACVSVVLGSGTSGLVCLGTLSILRLLERASRAAGKEPVVRRLLQTAMPLALGDDLKAGLNTAENLMVPKRLARFPGAADPLASFGTVCAMVFPVLMFPACILYALAELLIPELARCNAAGSQVRIRYLTRRSLRLALLYGCCFGGLLFLSSEPLCLGLYGNREAGRFLKLFSLLVPMLYCDAVTDAMIKGLGQQKASVRYNIFTSALDLALLFVLLPLWGMEGYFASFLVTHLINFALSLRRLLKISRVRIRVKVAVAALCCAVAAAWVAAAVPGVWLRCGAFLLVLGCLWVLTRVVSREDGLWLAGVIKNQPIQNRMG